MTCPQLPFMHMGVSFLPCKPRTIARETASACTILDLIVSRARRLLSDTLQIKRRDGQLVNTIVMFEV